MKPHERIRPVDPTELVARAENPGRNNKPFDHRTPYSPIQALMEAAPGDEPEVSQLELLELREVLVDALEELTPEEQWLLNALLIEKMPLRTAARVLGVPKSTVAYRRDSLLKKLRSKLSTNPAVQAHLERGMKPPH